MNYFGFCFKDIVHIFGGSSQILSNFGGHFYAFYCLLKGSRYRMGILLCTQRNFVCLFDLDPYIPSTIFQLYRDGSSCVEPVLS